MKRASTTRYTNRRPNLAVVLVLICASLSWGWISLSGKNPKEALAQATRQLANKSSNPQELESNLNISKKEPALKPWAFLLTAMLEQRRGNKEKALEAYRSIPSHSAASLDAQVAILQLELDSLKKEDRAMRVNTIGKRIEDFSRVDLLPKLELVRAMAFALDKNDKEALLRYQNIRKKFPRTLEAKIAQKKVAELLKGTTLSRSIPEQLENIQILLREQDIDQAERELLQVKSLTAPSSPARLEIMLVEEMVLRKEGKNTLADEVLGIVAAEGQIGTADVALKKKIFNHWNANDHQDALDSVSRFMTRFPSSPLASEVLYAKARILEEKGELSKAESTYKQADKRTNDISQRAKLLRQIAWAQVKDGNPKKAVASFEKLVSFLGKTKEFENSEELAHAIFWRAHYKHSIEKDKPLTKNEMRELHSIGGYYAGLLNQKKAERNAKNAPSLKNCGAPKLDDESTQHIEVFKYPGLEPFLRAEIAWISDLATKKGTDAESRLHKSLLKTTLYQFTDLHKETIRESSRSLILLEAVGSKFTKQCRMALQSASHPIAFKDDFHKRAAEFGVSPALLLAIARTESHFDANALSHRDAKGLLQLIDSTAAKEGLEDSENLFDPHVNIRLGAKHISRLLKKYNGEKIYAVAAYNAGSTAVERWRERYPSLSAIEWAEQIAYPETKNYVRKVLAAEAQYEEIL